MSASIHAAWAEGSLPLRSVLGTPVTCLSAAHELARCAEGAGDLPLAESILRGLCALDAAAPSAATSLARVLLARAIASADPRLAAEADAWARYALSLAPEDRAAATVSGRCAAVLRFLSR